VTGLVPDWLERQHAVTRPDRVMTITEYDERVTAALGVLSGTLYLVCRRLLLDTGSQPAEGVADTLSISSRELADRLGLANHTHIARLLNAQRWYMHRAEDPEVLRGSRGDLAGRAPIRWAVYGVPPLLPVDQVALHAFLQKRIRSSPAEEALEALQSVGRLAAQGWGVLRSELFSAPAEVAIGRGPFNARPLPLLSIAQLAAGLAPNRTPMSVVQATQVLRSSLRGQRTEIPLYLVDHWLPELGPTRFWILVQVLRECQAQGSDAASLSVRDTAERIGVSDRTLRRLLHDLDGLLDSLTAFTGAMVLSGARCEFRRVLYTPESTPLAPVHETDFLSMEGQKSTSAARPIGQNSTSGPDQNGQKGTSVRVQGGQKSTSAAGALDKIEHRQGPRKQGANGASQAPAQAVVDKKVLEEKSLNRESKEQVEPNWGVFWNAMQGHSKLKRRREVREQAEQHLTLWVATVLQQTTRGMDDPITQAVEGFDAGTAEQTVPYICLELAHRGPAFTAAVLARLAWPEVPWPEDVDLQRCVVEYLRIGVRSFRTEPATHAIAAISHLAISQLADQACAQARASAVEELLEGDLAPQVSDAVETDEDRLWAAVLSQLRMELPRATFDTWLAPTRLLHVQAGTYTVSAPSLYACEWLEHRMQGAIKRTLSRLVEMQDCTVGFRVESPG